MKVFILSLFFSLLFYNGFACSCNYSGNFSKAAKHTDLVAMVRIISHDDYFTMLPYDSTKRPMSVIVEIIKKYKGKEQSEKIKIFGDNGFLCRASILHMQEGEYYVVAVDKSQNQAWEYGVKETDNDYYVSSCGEYVLKYNPTNETVQGSIKGKSRRKRFMHIEKFNKLIEE